MVATSDGQLCSSVQCFLVTVNMSMAGTIIVHSKASASLYMRSQMEYAANDNQKMMITNIQFMNSESSDTLILCCGSQGEV